MKNRNKSILALGLLALSMQACNNGAEEPKVDVETKDSPMVMLTAEIDPTYEYDTEGLRAAQFSAEDAPRIKLTDEEFSTYTDGNGTSLSGARTYNHTTIRVNWLAFDTNNRLRGQEFLNIHKALNTSTIKTKIEVKERGGNYELNAWLRMSDLRSISPIPGATWFGQMILGGMPGMKDPQTGSEGRPIQYFAATRRWREAAGEYIDTAPNSRIDELDGTNGDMARRHFPMVGKLLEMRLWDNPGEAGSYDNNSGNTGQVISKDRFYLKPRGTIFTVTLNNKTGENIEVTDIEVPISGTRGQAFTFEGAFNGLNSRPFKDGAIDPDGGVPPFERYDGINPGRGVPYSNLYPGRSDVPPSFIYPIYRRGGQERNIELAPDQKSGRLMVWAYVNQPNKPFTLRVKYRANGQNLTSKYQILNPPASGFKESKAYRFEFDVKQQ